MIFCEIPLLVIEEIWHTWLIEFSKVFVVLSYLRFMDKLNALGLIRNYFRWPVLTHLLQNISTSIWNHIPPHANMPFNSTEILRWVLTFIFWLRHNSSLLWLVDLLNSADSSLSWFLGFCSSKCVILKLEKKCGTSLTCLEQWLDKNLKFTFSLLL